MSGKQIFNSFSGSNQNIGSPIVDWPGGAGWIIVSGTFTGGAQLANFAVPITELGVTGIAPISAISAAGTYEFSAPKGSLSATLQMAVGDSVSGLTVAVVPIG